MPPEPDDPVTAEELRSFEMRCLDELRGVLTSESGPIRRHWGGRLIDAELRGSYPDTEVTVSFDDRDGVRQRVTLPLWEERTPPSAVRDPRLPASVATILAVNVAGL
jgi:hypothetical protein